MHCIFGEDDDGDKQTMMATKNDDDN